jgi:glycosyltransferase involved in cell wall biosynthesis
VNILIINHYAGSDRMGMEYRPFYLAREWAADGHRATVVGAAWSHLRNRQPAVRVDLDVTEEEGVRFRWIRVNSYVGNGARRVANMMNFVGKLLLYADRLAREERPDLTICSSTYPLDIYPGERIAQKTAGRLVFEVHDLWPLTPILLGGYSPRHPYIRVLQRAEDAAYRKADAVVSLLPNALEYMTTRGLDPRKFVHIPNGIPLSGIAVNALGALPGPVAEAVARERGRGRFLIGFAGGINMNMALETLLDAARILRNDEVAFLIAGDGQNAARLRKRVDACGLDNFHMVGRIPKSSVQPFLVSMDALAIPWHCNPLYRYGVSPNKLFDYMLAGKPILQASEAANDLVAEANCGFTVAPEDPEALAAAVRRLSALPAEERRRLGENGHCFVAEKHDFRVLAHRFLDATASVPVGRGASQSVPMAFL